MTKTMMTGGGVGGSDNGGDACAGDGDGGGGGVATGIAPCMAASSSSRPWGLGAIPIINGWAREYAHDRLTKQDAEVLGRAFGSDTGQQAFEALAMLVALGASTNFITPVGHPANILVMGPGGYRFKDFTKVGLPLTILVMITVLIVLPHFWPLIL